MKFETRSVLLAGIMMTIGVAGCATSSESEETEEVEETATESSGGMANVSTVRSESKRNARERKRVSGVIEEHTAVLEACNLRSLAVEDRSRSSQEITFGWSVGQSGTPRDIHVVDNQLEGTGIAACVAGQLRNMEFPPPETESIKVEYPIRFREGETRGTGDWYERVNTAFRESWMPPESIRPEGWGSDEEQSREEKAAEDGDGEEGEGEEESESPEIPEELRKRVEGTVVFIDVSRSGEVESYEFLQRPDDEEFVKTVVDGIEGVNGESDGTWPMPRRSDLQERIAATGIVLQNWLEPEEDDKEGEDGDEAPDSEDSEPKS